MPVANSRQILADRKTELQVANVGNARGNTQDDDNNWVVVSNPTDGVTENTQNPNVQEFSRHFDWTLRWGDWSHTVLTADLKFKREVSSSRRNE